MSKENKNRHNKPFRQHQHDTPSLIDMLKEANKNEIKKMELIKKSDPAIINKIKPYKNIHPDIIMQASIGRVNADIPDTLAKKLLKIMDDNRTNILADEENQYSVARNSNGYQITILKDL